MKKFLGHSPGSLRGAIHRAIIAYPENEFTTRQLYEFMVLDFKVETNSGSTNLKGYRPRNANMPRSVNSLSSILSQAVREGVISRTMGRKNTTWAKIEEKQPCPECGRTFTDDHACEEAEDNA